VKRSLESGLLREEEKTALLHTRVVLGTGTAILPRWQKGWEVSQGISVLGFDPLPIDLNSVGAGLLAAEGRRVADREEEAHYRLYVRGEVC